MGLISILNILLAFYYFYILPHEIYIDNIKNGISELCLIVMQVTVCLLVKDE